MLFFVTTTVVFVLAFANLYFVQKTSINSYAYVLRAAILICYSLWYFYVLIRDLPSLYVHQMPMFWFNSAFLVMSAGAFFLFAFTSYLINVLRNDLLIYWSFHNILSILEHIIIMIGLYYDFRQFKAGSPKSSMHPGV